MTPGGSNGSEGIALVFLSLFALPRVIDAKEKCVFKPLLVLESCRIREGMRNNKRNPPVDRPPTTKKKPD